MGWGGDEGVMRNGVRVIGRWTGDGDGGDSGMMGRREGRQGGKGGDERMEG